MILKKRIPSPSIRQRLQQSGVLCLVLLVWLSQSTWAVEQETATTETTGTGTCIAGGDVGDGTCTAESTPVPMKYEIDTKFCQDHSQTVMALDMVQHSSPPDSKSYQKLYNLLHHYTRFFVDIQAGNGIFEDVTKNMATMMAGYGLTRVPAHNTYDNTISFLTILLNQFGINKLQRMAQITTTNNDAAYSEAIILLQTEQVCCFDYQSEANNDKGAVILAGLRLCHQARDCVILEYSHQNYKWFLEQGMGDSVVLMPILNQGRLDSYYDSLNTEQQPQVTKPMSERSIDVVFFGYMTARRKILIEQFNQKATAHQMQQDQPWNMLIEDDPNRTTMATSYTNAKICLVIHSFGNYVPLETHRLSEMGPSGCLPVMEAFGDQLASVNAVYQRCGGVVFYQLQSLEDLDTLPRYLEHLLVDNLDNQQELQRRVEWWRNRIEWETLLPRIFGERKEKQ